jgi:hypothetical protein
MSIKYMGHEVGILRPSGLRGRVGPGTGLVQLDVELDWHGLAGMNVRLRLARVVGHLTIVIGEGRFDFGSIEYMDDGSPTSLPEHSWQMNLPFRLELLPVHVDAIERVRAGGKGTVELGVRLLLESEIVRADSGVDTTTAYDLVRFDMNPSQWLELLEETGYRREMLLSVPLAMAVDDQAWGSASMALERAEEALRDGLPREAVSSCREVFESLQRRWPKPEGPPKPTWSVDKRYRTLVEAGRHLCHSAHPDAFYDMSDARVVFALAASLLAKAMRGESVGR